MSSSAAPVPLIGYCDRLSGRPGDTIAFKVSSQLEAPYSARLVRIISADPNPGGPGLIEEDCDFGFGGTYPSRSQDFFPGSYAVIDGVPPVPADGVPLTLSAIIWPTTPEKGLQTILAFGNFRLCISAEIGACAIAGDQQVSVGKRLRERAWYKVEACLDAVAGILSVSQLELGQGEEYLSQQADASEVFASEGGISIAARTVGGVA
ncbi:MAG: N,N-dimethylformamidase large subunit, partial [Pseudomonadota bacterium]